jgi:hypothetical protein
LDAWPQWIALIDAVTRFAGSGRAEGISTAFELHEIMAGAQIGPRRRKGMDSLLPARPRVVSGGSLSPTPQSPWDNFT